MNKWLWLFLFVVTLAGGVTFWVESNKTTDTPKSASAKKKVATDEDADAVDAPIPTEAAVGGGFVRPVGHEDTTLSPHVADHLGAKNTEPGPRHPGDTAAAMPPPGGGSGPSLDTLNGDNGLSAPPPQAELANPPPNGYPGNTPPYDATMPPPNYNYPPPNYPDSGYNADNAGPGTDFDGTPPAEYVAPEPIQQNPDNELPGGPIDDNGGY